MSAAVFPPPTLAELFLPVMAERDLTTCRVAREAGIDPSYFYRILHKGQPISIDAAVRIGGVLDIAPGDIVAAQARRQVFDYVAERGLADSNTASPERQGRVVVRKTPRARRMPEVAG